MGARLVLTLDDNGQFRLEGPITNKVLVYGMLGLAWESVMKREASSIIRPAGPLPVPPPQT